MNITLKNVACVVGAAGLLALAGAPAALAQQDRQPTRPQDQRQPQQVDRARAPDAVVERTAAFDLMFDRASDLLGKAIHARNGDKIGDVADFVVSRRSGAIDSVLINTGAIMGVGGKEVRVPYHSLTWNAANKRLETTATKASLDAMTAFDRDRAADMDLTNLPDHTRNDADRTRQPATYGETYGPDRGILLSTLVGMNLNCLTQECGEVEDAIIEVNSGNVVFLVIDPDENFLGIADTLRLAPFTIASWNVDAKEMRIDATKEQLLAAPEFDGNLTPFATRVRVTEVYGVYDRPAPRLDTRASERMKSIDSQNLNNMNQDRSRTDPSTPQTPERPKRPS